MTQSATAAGSQRVTRRQSFLAYQGSVDPELLEYCTVQARPLSHLPPSPPDHARAPTLDEVRVGGLGVGSPGILVAQRARCNASQFRRIGTDVVPEPVNGFAVYPMFEEDVHHMIRCVLVPLSVRELAAPASLQFHD
jgi:hypothetical protein